MTLASPIYSLKYETREPLDKIAGRKRGVDYDLPSNNITDYVKVINTVAEGERV